MSKLVETQVFNSQLIATGWEIDVVDGILSRIIDYRGKTPSKTESGIPLITAKNVRNGYIEDEPREYISELAYESWMTRGIPKHGDVLFTTEAPLANVAQITSKRRLAFAQRVIILQTNGRMFSGFLKYLLMAESIRKRIFAKSTGSTVEGIKQSVFRRICISFPESLTEQRKIARILTTLDNLIEKTEALIAKYQAIKQGMMHDLFTRGVDSDGQLRPTQEQAPDLYKQSELGWIPKEWCLHTFGDSISYMDSGWSPICETTPASHGECGSLKTTSISWEGYDPNENKRLPDELSPEVKAFVRPDDILITRVGPRNRIGVVAHVDHTPDALMVSDNMLRLRLTNHEILRPAFVPLILSSHAIQSRWEGRKVGLAEAQMVITQHVVRNTLVSVPPVQEQEMIVDRHAKCQSVIRAERRRRENLLVVKSGLMQDLLTGKVRVKVDEAEEITAHA
ncbi:restriction endonuclease subunit S [Rubinisphaera italica]|uniref:EcoKI restriction-modification system protein HsdS n=1 Tax=Rubinisphaera italica TaxID=2527969 RepID=A0A5C5XL32_9PLAN|nr:restriction endonuclease subunit S [Rubinisphaera italica]TWT62855.1 EcoKI restriction-modification system protein HsdS [Rubinisphaera italica]